MPSLGGPVVHVVGARPNFMKIAPVHRALAARGCDQRVIHTGQHYDSNMSEVFFAQLGIPAPDLNLGVGSGSHAEQTARIMIGLERALLAERPRVVLVYGDVNSTAAAALVCSKLLVSIAHVEAGLRSGDRTMPEEINRLVTDQLADALYTPSAEADVNLAREGVAPERIVFVGNVMIDTLVRLLPDAEAAWTREWAARVPARFGLVTLHRPSNVDDEEMLRVVLHALATIARDLPLLFPLHPRTLERITSFNMGTMLTGITLLDPVSYLDFLALQQRATVVITDSGGVQEETTFLGVPCITVRENTERPVTVAMGTNILVGRDTERLVDEVRAVLDGGGKRGERPPLWDGHAGERIADDVLARFGQA